MFTVHSVSLTVLTLIFTFTLHTLINDGHMVAQCQNYHVTEKNLMRMLAEVLNLSLKLFCQNELK